MSLSLTLLANVLVSIGLNDLLGIYIVIELNSIQVLLERRHVLYEILQLSITSHREVFDHLVEVNHIVVDVFQSPSKNKADVCHVNWNFNLRHIHMLLSPLEEDVFVGSVG